MFEGFSIPLRDYLKTKTQAQVASELHLSQGAISKMVRRGRNVFITKQRDGTVRCFEVKDVGGDKGADCAA